MPTKAKSKQSQTNGEPVRMPADACSFRAQVVRFPEQAGKYAKQETEEGVELLPVRLLARSRGAVPSTHHATGYHTVFHELEGIEYEGDRVMIDFEHWEAIGYASDPVIDDDGYWLDAVLVATQSSDDKARAIYQRGRGGVPYEASIYFDNPVVEHVDWGATAEVNGETVEGPCAIVRKCTLRGVAICRYGHDSETAAEFSAEAAAKRAEELAEQNTPPDSDGDGMSKETPTAGSQAAPEAPGTTPAEAPESTTTPAPESATTEETPAGDTPDEPAGDATADAVASGATEYRAELKRYCSTFGTERGAQYFGDGIEYSKALEEDHRRLTTEVDGLRQQLSGKSAADAAGAGIGDEEAAGGKYSADSPNPSRKTPFRFA